MRVLIVEDDAMLSAMVSRALRADGHVVEEATTFAEGRRQSTSGQFQLLLIDWNLPDGIGPDLIATYRGAGGSGGAILITARNSVADQVVGLDAGADDFVCKPFEISALRARIRALMRRPTEWTTQILTIGDLTIDGERKTALVHGQVLDLTLKEWQVLWSLAQHDGRPAPRAAVVGQVWEGNHEPDIHALEVHVSNLRGKLAASRSAVRIVARRGAGYQLAPPPAASHPG